MVQMDVTASYDLQATDSSTSRCSVQMVQMDDITDSYDMQTGGISWVWCMDDIAASYYMQTDGISLVWYNWYAWAIEEMHERDRCSCQQQLQRWIDWSAVHRIYEGAFDEAAQ